MTTGGYRWGRKANLIAGASIAIALRESNKSASLRDIAFLLDDSHLSLSRAFQSVVSLLNFSLAPTDPSVHLPALQTHLLSLIHSDSTSFPADLCTTLSSLSLPAAVRTATSIAGIITAHQPTLAITRLPTPPTACALLILALEAESRAPLSHVSELARVLAARFGVASGVVSSRYKSLYDTIEEWIREVPWLDQFSQSKSRGARPKLSKRAVVAKGVKDIIRVKEEIWKNYIQARHEISLVMDPDLGENTSGNVPSHREGDDLQCTRESESTSSSAVASKRRKTTHGSLYEAYRLLLNPLSSSATLSPLLHAGTTASAGDHDIDISLATDLLTRPSFATVEEEQDRQQKVTQTRLQLLAASRGGTAPSDISDDELFELGELEGLLRSDAEREALAPLFELNWGSLVQDRAQDDLAESSVPKRKKNQRSGQAESKRGTKRINMDVLGRILERGTEASLSDTDSDSGSDSYFSLDKANVTGPSDLFGEDASSLIPIRPRSGRVPLPAGERRQQQEGADATPEIIEDWRPLSPGPESERGFWRFDDTASAECRYEEW